MTDSPREALLRLYRRQGVTRAWPQFSLCPAQRQAWRARDSRRYGDALGFPARGCQVAMRRTRELDWRAVYPGWVEGTWVDDTWSVAHEPGSAEAHHMTRMRHPLANADADGLAAWAWPDPGTIDHAALAADVALAHDAGLAHETGLECTILETSWYLRSMEQLMIDMSDDSPLAAWLLDQVTALNTARALAAVAAGTDILCLGDDIGTQRGPLLSPRMWARHIQPRLARLIAAAKRQRPELLVRYHSCGDCRAFIPGLIDAGVDILDPLQPECMDAEAVVRAHGDRLSFHGGIGTQSTMPFGTPDEVFRRTHALLDLGGSRGGMLACPTHLIEPEVPWANLAAYLEAVRSWKP